MQFMRKQLLARVSPWVLAAACGLLSLIIGVFAVNNYQRDKALMTDILLEKGATLIRFVASSSRNSIFSGLRGGQDIDTLWPGNVQQVLEHASGHPGVKYLALVDSDGVIIANSVPEERNRLVSEETRSFILDLDDRSLQSRTFSFRISKDEKQPVFQIAALSPPFGKRFLDQLGTFIHPKTSRGERISGWRLHKGKNPKWKEAIEELNKKRFVILVELDMEQFNQRLQRQKLEIIILSIVLLLVGFGGWLSILTLEGLKGSQSRLRRVEAYRDILISSLPVGLIATDNKGRIILYNRFSQELTGVQEKQALGQTTAVFKDLPELREAFASPEKQHGVPVPREVCLIGDTGSRHTVQLSRLAIIDSDDSFVGTLIMIQDLSQVKKLEEDLRKSERLAALGKMAAGVAHELRNPLSSIKGLALLLQSKFTEQNKDRETATIMVQEVERLNRSISELLDYARPQKLQKKEVYLQSFLQKAVSLIRIDAEAAGVEMVVDLPVDLPPIPGDEDKLNQVFLNLFLNAIQAMEHGGKLKVSATGAEGRVRIVVSDTGCGIAPEDIGRVFDPYFTTKPEGTGLGMAMSAKIIEEHGGEVTLESKQEQGTSVIVEIPC
jgi:two-component system, NtrC family, sensor histidine kinase HydH